LGRSLALSRDDHSYCRRAKYINVAQLRRSSVFGGLAFFNRRGLRVFRDVCMVPPLLCRPLVWHEEGFPEGPLTPIAVYRDGAPTSSPNGPCSTFPAGRELDVEIGAFGSLGTEA